jgi:hypothetical protein
MEYRIIKYKINRYGWDYPHIPQLYFVQKKIGVSWFTIKEKYKKDNSPFVYKQNMVFDLEQAESYVERHTNINHGGFQAVYYFFLFFTCGLTIWTIWAGIKFTCDSAPFAIGLVLSFISMMLLACMTVEQFNDEE